MRRIAFVFCIAGLMGLPVTGQATPKLYTFEGHVSRIWDDAGIIAEAGLTEGSPLSYVFKVDADRPGYEINPVTGQAWTSPDYFYVELVSGQKLASKGGGLYADPSNFYYGRYLASPQTDFYWTAWRTGNTNAPVGLDCYRNWLDPEIGDHVDVLFESATSQETNSFFHSYDMQLINITAAPVPEPGTLLLTGSGLIGLAAYGRRKFHRG